MKKIFAILMLAVMLLGLTACDSPLDALSSLGGGGLPQTVVPQETKETVWLVTEISANNSANKFTFTYDEKGNLTEYIYDGSWQTRATYTYNDKNVLTSSTYYDNGESSYSSAYSYDGNNNLITRLDDDGYRVDYTYDDQGNLLATNAYWEEDGPEYGYQYTYTYDDAGRKITESIYDEGWEDSSKTYTYNNAGRISQITYYDGYDYDGYSDFTYDDAGKLVKIVWYDEDGWEEDRCEYTYDDNGCLIEERKYYEGYLSSTTTFTYQSISVSPARAKVLRKQNLENIGMDW